MSTKQADCCTSRYYEVTSKDLPLCCPMTDMQLWNAHPRVYLPIEKKGHIVCPYCEAHYILTDYQKSE